MEDDEHKSKIIKYYIQGKSYEDLKIAMQNMDIHDPAILLQDIHEQYSERREKVARRDLWLAIADLLVLVTIIVVWILGITFRFQIHFAILLSFIWIPFMRSFLTVYKDRKKFD